ncbi:hypothetical protein BSKO_10388 [Bryopsis sp. KO-2023]|nr:hypothetical protein BSKO_10388 [Bryopsis sp. KO-2023]
MGWTENYDCSTPRRNAHHRRETSSGSGHTSDTGASPSSSSPNRYEARYDAGLSKVRDDRLDFFSNAHAARADGTSQVSPRTPSGTRGSGRVGRVIGDWRTSGDSLGQTPPQDEQFSTTPRTKTPFRTPQSIATTVFYTPASSWDRDSDAGPSGGFEFVNVGSGKDWLVSGHSQNREIEGNAESKNEAKTFLCLNTDYLSVKRCSDLLSETDALGKKMAELLKGMGR